MIIIVTSITVVRFAGGMVMFSRVSIRSISSHVCTMPVITFVVITSVTVVFMVRFWGGVMMLSRVSVRSISSHVCTMPVITFVVITSVTVVFVVRFWGGVMMLSRFSFRGTSTNRGIRRQATSETLSIGLVGSVAAVMTIITFVAVIMIISITVVLVMRFWGGVMMPGSVSIRGTSSRGRVRRQATSEALRVGLVSCDRGGSDSRKKGDDSSEPHF